MVFTIVITIYVLHLQPCERRLTKVKQAGGQLRSYVRRGRRATIPRRAREREKKVCYEKEGKLLDPLSRAYLGRRCLRQRLTQST